MPVVSDNYFADASLVIAEVSGNVDVTTPGSYVLEFSVTDPLGNVGTGTRTVTVVDTTPPVITLANPNLTFAKLINDFNYLEQGGSAVDIVVPDISLVVTVFEMSGGSQEVALTADPSNSAYYPGLWRVQPDISNGVIVNNGKGKSGHYKVKYNATDGVNAASEIVRNIYILRDVENPTIEVSGVVNVQVGSDPSGVAIMGDVSGIELESGLVTSAADFITQASSKLGYYSSDYIMINDSNWLPSELTLVTDLSTATLTDNSFVLIGDFSETITVTDPDNNSANVFRRIKVVDSVGPSFTLAGDGLDLNNRLVLSSTSEAGNKFADISNVIQSTNNADVNSWLTVPDTTVTSSLIGEVNIEVVGVDINGVSSQPQMRYALFI